MKRVVLCPDIPRRDFDSEIIFLSSETPEVTALIVSRWKFDVEVIRFASVVLPVPGGPHKINDGILPASILFLSGLSLSVKWACPTMPSKLVGRILAAKGAPWDRCLFASKSNMFIF